MYSDIIHIFTAEFGRLESVALHLYQKRAEEYLAGAVKTKKNNAGGEKYRDGKDTKAKFKTAKTQGRKPLARPKVTSLP